MTQRLAGDACYRFVGGRTVAVHADEGETVDPHAGSEGNRR